MSGRPAVSEMRRRSDTVPGRSYKVEIQDGRGVCDCQGYTTHGHCKHVEEALKMVNGGQSRELVPADDAENGEPTALALSIPSRLLPTTDELAVMGRIAKTLVQARGHAIPETIDSPAKAAAVMLAGWEVGLRPMTAFRHIFVVNGRTELDSQAMMGLVKSGDPTADFVFHRYDAAVCDVELRRGGRLAARCEYTIEDARRSGQTKSRSGDKATWSGFPRDMLAWAAVKRVCRLGAPDLINAFSQMSVADAGALISEPEADEDGVVIEPQAPTLEGGPTDPAADPRGDPSQVTAEDLAAEQPPGKYAGREA